MSEEVNISGKLNSSQFEKLFKDYFNPLCAFAVRYTKDFDTAREIVHNVFVTIWEKRDTVKENQNIRSYLYTSVYNRSLNYIRDSKKTVELDPQAEAGLKVEGHQDLESEELKARIDAAIQSLPDRCREIFVLSRYEELKYSEIAKKLDLSVKTIEVQMSKALKLLRENLAEFLSIIIILFFK